MPEKTTRVYIGEIVLDPELQMRAGEIDTDFVATLAEKLREGVTLRPLILFEDPQEDGTALHYIGDGNHRFCAHRMAGVTLVPAVIHPGGREAALQHALGANADQDAKPRTRKDLRRAVTIALQRYLINAPAKERLTQAQIADICKTSQPTVSNVYAELKRQAASKKQPPKPPEQLDFWDVLTSDFEKVLDVARAKRLKDTYRQQITANPERAAEEIEAIADTLQGEYRELKALVADIRTGLNPSKR